MDMHDLARAIHRAWAKNTHDIPGQWAKIADAYRDAADLLPLVEAHTAAAVEAERAACEAAVDKLMAQSHKVMRETSTGDELHKAACIEALALSCARAVVASRKAPE